MAQTLPNVPRPTPRKMLSGHAGKSERPDPTGNFVSDHEIARVFGHEIARALEMAGITPQEAVHQLRYANQSPISKLVNPTEPPALAKIYTLPGFKAAYAEVLADGTKEWVRVVRLERRRNA